MSPDLPRERAGLPEPTYFLEQDMEGCALAEFAGGAVAVFSCRSPAKDTVNEDAVALVPISERRGVIAIADGVGGLRAGAVAARMALEHLAAAIAGQEESAESARGSILDGIEAANRAVLEAEAGGTTLALVDLFDGRLRPYHVGDSMILVTGQRGLLKLQTVPHSPTGYAVESGMLDEWEAMVHEDRHLIDNMIGSDRMRIEMGHSFELARHDTVVIASDGLCDNLHPTEIVEIVRKGPLARAGERLRVACRRRMLEPEEGHPSKTDDLSFVVYRRA